jgi:hypothetical protein
MSWPLYGRSIAWNVWGKRAVPRFNDLAIVAPDWLRQQVTADWFERDGTRIEDSRLPKGEAQRYA